MSRSYTQLVVFDIEQDCRNTETWTEINGDNRKAIIWTESCEVYNGGFFRIYTVDLYWRGE